MTHLHMIRRPAGRATVVALALVVAASQRLTGQAAPSTFFACYVPSVGAIYMIKRTGLPQACLGPTHVEITWTDGAGAGSGTITGVTAGDGLTGGGTSGVVSLAVAFGGPGAAASVARSDHAHQLAGSNNTAVGANALVANTTGGFNTAMGTGALSANTAGTQNTAFGSGALLSHVDGNDNTAIGIATLREDVAGTRNTAVGAHALRSNASGNQNTAVGVNALTSTTTAVNNTAVGVGALRDNTADANTAVGVQALNLNTTGSGNTAMGTGALNRNTTGSENTAVGLNSIFFNTTGARNTAVGFYALDDITTGDDNIAVGYDAGGLLTSGSRNIYIGSGTQGSESDVIRIGNTANSAMRTFLAGIRGVTTGAADAIPVLISSAGQLGTVSSSRRFKEDIRPLGDAARGLMQLRPVRFRYIEPAADGGKPQHYGLIAEEVAEVFPDLVAYDSAGVPETVYYHVLPVLLLSEVQRQERELSALREAVARQAAELEHMRAEVRRIRR